MIYFRYIFLLICNLTFAQTQFTISGWLPQAPLKELKLKRFNSFGDTLVAKVKTDIDGKFSLSYPEKYVGSALLEISNVKSLILLLNHENFQIQWKNLEDFKTLKFNDSKENDFFERGLNLYLNTEGKRAGLTYLLAYYENDSVKLKFLNNEIKETDELMPFFLKKIPEESYVKYYLKIRMLFALISNYSNKSFDDISEYEKEFNSIDFADPKLIHSGLYEQLLEIYFIMLESYGSQSNSHFEKSIDMILNSVKNEPILKQDVAEFLFKLFEKRSLFFASEYIALSMLSDNSCQIDIKREFIFEQYRKMSIGKTAPDIFLNVKTFNKKLSDIKNKYRLVVFGSSWCSKCREELPKIKEYYFQWKMNYDLEVVYISLDIDKEKNEAFIKEFPWISSCDYKGWEGDATKDYHIFSTPIMYLLDNNQKIILKPISIEQINSWFKIKN